MKRLTILSILISFILPIKTFSQELQISDYLILEDIPPYKVSVEHMVSDVGLFGGPKSYGGSGILGGTGHWKEDHEDYTYEVNYYTDFAVTVKLTHHCPPPRCTAPTTTPNGLSWLLHEAEDTYRDGDNKEGRLGLLSGASAGIEEIDGNKILYFGLGGGSYIWISGNKVIEIEYTDLQRTKPEPIEIVKAYLAKHPSSIPAMTLDKAHDEVWIKDEMARRLWLAEKEWANIESTVAHLDKHLEIFLNYREKYFGVSGKAEKKELWTVTDPVKVRAKIKAYKDWFAANKTKPITLSGGFIGKLWVRFARILPNFFLSKKG